MIHSCFDPKTGLYDYYQSSLQIPYNADLPVPKLPSMAGNVGVPAMEAGRPMPSGAKHIGRGWHARGMISRCDGGGVSGFGSVDGAVAWVKDGGWKYIAAGAVGWVVMKKVFG